MDTPPAADTIYAQSVGAGPTVLFVHGFPLSGQMWLPTTEALKDRFLCVVPDLRGHGRTPPVSQVSMTSFADDLAALLDHLKIWEPVILVGLSMGGMIGFEFFRRHRSRVRAMVMCDTRAVADGPDGIARREALARDVLMSGSRVAADAMVPKLFAPSTPQSIRDRWHAIISATPPEGVAAASRALAFRPDSTATLATIDYPTLYLCGEFDELTPPDMMRDMHRATPQSQFVLIPHAGHLPPVEQPHAFIAALVGFVDSLPPR